MADAPYQTPAPEADDFSDVDFDDLTPREERVVQAMVQRLVSGRERPEWSAHLDAKGTKTSRVMWSHAVALAVMFTAMAFLGYVAGWRAAPEASGRDGPVRVTTETFVPEGTFAVRLLALPSDAREAVPALERYTAAAESLAALGPGTRCASGERLTLCAPRTVEVGGGVWVLGEPVAPQGLWRATRREQTTREGASL